MALAPMVYAICNRAMRFDMNDPIWPNRRGHHLDFKVTGETRTHNHRGHIPALSSC
jgi:hypothetical protein